MTNWIPHNGRDYPFWPPGLDSGEFVEVRGRTNASINRGPASGFSWQDRTGLEAEFNIKSWRRVPVGEGNKETGPAKEASPNFRNCDPSDASEDDGKVIAQIAREMAAHEDNSASSTKRGETQ